MNTSNLYITSVNSADTVIVAVSGDIVGNIVASLLDITEIVSASISIVAVVEGVYAFSSCKITTIISASIAIIAANGNGIANSVGNIALIVEAIELRAGYNNWIFTLVAIYGNVSASSLKVATVSSARVIIITVHCRELASYSRIAGRIVACI